MPINDIPGSISVLDIVELATGVNILEGTPDTTEIKSETTSTNPLTGCEEKKVFDAQVNTGDILSTEIVCGKDNTDTNKNAYIAQVVASDNWSVTNTPCAYVISTPINNIPSPIERLRINPDLNELHTSRIYVFGRPVLSGGYTLTSSPEVKNTTLETDLISPTVSTGFGTLQLSANTAVPGSTSELNVSGKFETDSKVNLTLRLYLGTNVINTLEFKYDDTKEQTGFKLNCGWTVKSIGVNASLDSNVFMHYIKNDGSVKAAASVQSVVFDSTINQDIKITAQWATADIQNCIRATEATTTNLYTPL